MFVQYLIKKILALLIRMSIEPNRIIICLSSNGNIRSFPIQQTLAYTHFEGNSISFCGAIPSLNIVALARKTRREQDQLNPFSMTFSNVFEKTYGDILLLGTDENGEECDVDVPKTVDFLNQIPEQSGTNESRKP